MVLDLNTELLACSITVGSFKGEKYNIYDLLKVAVRFIMTGGGSLPSSSFSITSKYMPKK